MDIARPPQKSAIPSDTSTTPHPTVSTPVPAARPAATAPAALRPMPNLEQHPNPTATASAAPIPSATPAPKPAVPIPESKPAVAAVQAQQAPAPLTVRQAPKDDSEKMTGPAEAKPSQLAAEPEHHPKPKPATGQQGPVGAIVVTVLMMFALSALAIAIYVNV